MKEEKEEGEEEEQQDEGHGEDPPGDALAARDGVHRLGHRTSCPGREPSGTARGWVEGQHILSGREETST